MKRPSTPLKQRIDSMNQYSLVTYLNLLGHTPIFANEEYTIYTVPQPNDTQALLTVYNRTNRFHFELKAAEGGVVELACLLFQLKPREILDNIVPYRLDLLLESNADHAGHRA